MPDKPPYFQFLRIATTVSLLFAVTLVVFVNWCTFQWHGWFDLAPACLWGITGLLHLVPLTILARRYLVVPASGIVSLAALLIVLVWTNPLSPRTRFFAEVGQLKPGMTINAVRTRLPQYSMSCDTPPGCATSETRAATVHGFAPHFTGYVLCTPGATSSDNARFDVQNGIVTAISRYADD